MYATIKQIKSQAKEKLLSNMWTAVFFTIFHISLTNLCSFCLMVVPAGGSIVSLLFYELTTLMIHLFAGILQMGVAAFYLNASSDNDTPSLSDLFYAFSHGPDRALKVSLILSLIHMICTLPYIVYTLFIMPVYTFDDLMSLAPAAIESMGFAYLLLGIGELLYFLICLFFEPVYFMLVDMPGLSAMKAMKMSVWLMKGSKVRLLGLNLSFLPLQFISLLTFGIGNLWVTPYMNLASTEFYMDLSAKRTNH